MRMTTAVLLAAFLGMVASAAHAANFTFGLNGGISSPTGDFSDESKLGFNGGVYADYWIKDDYAFGADINGSFSNGKDDFINTFKSTGYPNPDLKSTLINFGLHGVWAPAMKSTPVQPWITYGAGLYHVGFKLTDAGTANFDRSDNKFGFNGGVGLDFKSMAMTRVGADVKYHYVLDGIEKANTAGGTDKKAANYLTAGVHVTFTTTGAK